jgi:hypothetical protein
MPTSTDLVTDLPADFEVFGQAVDTSLADLKGGTTGQVLKKNSNTDMDFVWGADSAGMTNPMTTTGDTIYSSSGSTPARLGIGTTGQLLTVAGGVPTWATPAAAGGMTLLSTTTLTGASTTVSSISGSYKDLIIIVQDWATASNGQVFVRMNSDSTAQAYRFGYLWANPVSGGTAGSGMINSDKVNFNHSAYANSSNPDSFATITIKNYANTNAYKSIIIHSYYNGESAGDRLTEFKYGTWADSAAISSIYFSGTSNISGTAYIYGAN